ncbi:hypothetical protein ACFY1L_22600 [Streptomyces sp. NPDC001663]|uniref:hypothetical protein n=1 Tax=Streptomyces sp. NPDC001663 TaxID=3364597 RepID=UPI00367C70DB
MTALATGTARAVVRVHRTALIVWAAFIVGAVAYLVWLNKVTAPDARAQAATCKPDTGFCSAFLATRDYTEPMGWISTVVYYSFWAVAAWAGSALIGRELENGTARLAWTQGVSPARWLATKLAVPALVLVLGGALFVPVFRWAWSANRDLMGDDWTFNDVFAARGPAVVAWSLCALAVGALAAVVLSRSLPALAVAVALMIALNQYMEPHREDLWPTDGNGQYANHHPQSHFWPMNLVETGILLTIAALATTAAFLVLGHRTARTPRKESLA